MRGVPDGVLRAELPSQPSSARAARALVRQHLVATHPSGPPPASEAVVDAAVLVASELVTNAVRHAASAQLVLLVRAEDGGAAVGVQDASTDHPAHVAPYDGGGRGMLVVGSLARRWHVEDVPGGKVVWAHVGPEGEPGQAD